jgi:hypothetical protein
MLLGLPAAGLLSGACAFAQTPVFTPGNVVVAVEGCGVQGGTCTSTPNGTGTGAGNSSSGGYGDNQGAPLTLFQFSPNGTTSASYVNSLVLPQTRSNADMPFSGEYGSSSEATLQLSGTGQYLTIGGYGIKAAEFNANPGVYSSSSNTAPAALAQTGSLTGQSYTPVARVAALIDPYGNVNTSSDFYNIRAPAETRPAASSTRSCTPPTTRPQRLPGPTAVQAPHRIRAPCRSITERYTSRSIAKADRRAAASSAI